LQQLLGVSLLSVVGKVFARVVLSRLQQIADRVYPESQCGFRSARSTIDMVFSVRQLQEKCREQNQPLFMAFIDLTKAFDLVSRSGLFAVLAKTGYPPKLLDIICSFHTGMKGRVLVDGVISEEFDVKSGVKQGCVLAPTLVGIYFYLLLKNAFGASIEGVLLHTRSDGKLFNLARLKALTKVKEVSICELLFADDAALVANSESELQCLLDRFPTSCQLFGLTISTSKTQVMGQGAPFGTGISLEGNSLEAVHQFKYLGCILSDTLSLDSKLSTHIGKTAIVMSSLTKRVWQNRKLSVKTKIAVYRSYVLSVLLYGSESWTCYAIQERKLNSFHMRNLRRLLGITWKDKVANETVLQRTGMSTILSLLRQRRLRWVGHVKRMAEDRIPKLILLQPTPRGFAKCWPFKATFS